MNREILRLAIPNIIANLAVPILGIIELGITGHLGSELYIGAIGVGSMFFNFLFWMFAFLRMSMSGLTAQAFGSGNKSETGLMLYRGAFLGLCFGLILITLQKPLAAFVFHFLKSSPEIELLSAQYFYIRIWSAPATLMLYALMGWFIGMQNARIPMWISITSSIMALGFNLWFVYGLGMKSDGIALGTLLSQYGGLLLAIILLWINYKHVIKDTKINFKALTQSAGRFFSVNRDIFVRMLCIIFVFSFFTLQSANTDNFTLAVNTILIQFLFFFSFFVDGFAYAGEALVGRFTGAADYASLKKAVKGLFLWGIVIVIPFALAYFLFSEQILALITNRAEVLAAAKPYLPWIKWIPIITFAAYIWDGIYIGAAASRAMRNSMLISTLAIFLPVYLIFSHSIGNHALWLALLLFMVSRGILLSWMAPKTIFQHKK
jgi:MATE family multidrug resistance protein